MTSTRQAIFVSDGMTDPADGSARARADKLHAVSAYLYDGWRYDGWGSAPADCPLTGTRYGFGFFFSRESSDDGFGPAALTARLRSGLHTAYVLTDADRQRAGYDGSAHINRDNG